MTRKLGNLSPLRLRGQTALITGTTHGLGLAAAEALVNYDLSTLIMGVRDTKLGQALKTRLLAGATDLQPTIHVVELEMKDYQSVASFSEEVKKLTPVLDIVILNAGTGGLKFEVMKTGHEKTMQVNVLSNALLALQLLPLLVERAKATSIPSRMTWVGSFVQNDHSLKKSPLKPNESILGRFDDEKRFSALSQYSDSKLLTTMFVQELAKHIDSNEVIFNEVSPGPVATNFGANYPIYLKLMFMVLLSTKARSLSEGVKTYLYAIGVAGKESHGKYLSDNHIAP